MGYEFGVLLNLRYDQACRRRGRSDVGDRDSDLEPKNGLFGKQGRAETANEKERTINGYPPGF
jgi:hypothetical protein